MQLYFSIGKGLEGQKKMGHALLNAPYFVQEGTAPIQNPLIVVGKSQF